MATYNPKETSMSEYLDDVKKYAPGANEAVVAAISCRRPTFGPSDGSGC
jgi:hypothetical protein